MKSRLTALVLRSLVPIAILGVVLSSTPTPARAEVVERVVATVNETALFLSDLRARAVPFLAQLSSIEEPEKRVTALKQLYDDILTVMVEEELVRGLATQRGISVTASDVTHAIDGQREQYTLSEADFWKAVEQQGMDKSGYLDAVRKQLLRLKVLNERVRARVNITDDQVRRKYEALARAEGKTLRFHVADIPVSIGGDQTAVDVQAAKDIAEELILKLTPETFESLAPSYNGGNLGWVTQGDLPEALETVLLTMVPGTISAPIRTERAYHIFHLIEREAGGSLEPYDTMKKALFQELLDEAMQKQERIFLDELLRKSSVKRML